MAWTAPRTWVAAETVTAALGNTHWRDNFKAIGDPWTAYTPVLTAATVNPTLGTTGQLQTGAYIAAGKLIIVRLKMKFGTTAPAAGTGQYFVSLPVTAVGTATALVGGAAYMFDSSASAVNLPVAYLATTTTLGFFYPATWPSGAQTVVGAAAPWAWAGADELNASFVYEAA